MTEADADSSSRLGEHAFGVPLRPNTRPAFTTEGGIWRWALFDGNTLAAKAVDRAVDSMIGGRPVPTAGVGGVVVAPEYRGKGLARQVMTHLLREGRERGAVISSLFRTAPALYRSLGFEQVAELTYGRLPVSALHGMGVPDGITLRRATETEVPAIRAVYDEIAAGSSCMLTRRGPQHDKSPGDFIAAFDGITLALDDTGTVIGYTSWHRGDGLGEQAALTVTELLSTTASGTLALLAMLASFDAVVGEIRLRTTGTDPIQWLISGAGWAITQVQPYMLRILDLPGALAARGWPRAVGGSFAVSVNDPVCPWNSGTFRWEFHNGYGRAVLQPTLEPQMALTPTGVAVLFAGGVTAWNLRRAGLLTGGSFELDALLDAVMAGPRPGILDFF